MDNLNWIQNWYLKQCDGYWEHDYGIKISNIDNPGWDLTIDIFETLLEGTTLKYELFEKSENDWYAFEVKNNQFIGIGDPLKLNLLIQIFRKLYEEAENKKKNNGI